jgi:Alpha and gamma adaptin binding protein p34
VGTEGRERIIEALGSTVWENLRQKRIYINAHNIPFIYHSLLLTARAERRLEDQLNMLSLGEDGLDGDLPLGEGAAPTFDPLNFDEDLRLARGEFRHATDEIAQNLRALQNLLRETEAPSGVDEGMEGVPPEEDNTEASVEQFESALTGLRRLRENAQQLPDAQRKALAAQVISMLFPD